MKNAHLKNLIQDQTMIILLYELPVSCVQEADCLRILDECFFAVESEERDEDRMIIVAGECCRVLLGQGFDGRLLIFGEEQIE